MITASVLMGIALLLVLRVLLGSGPAPVPVQVANTANTDALGPPATRVHIVPRFGATKNANRKVSAAPHSIDPTLRYDWLNVGEKTKYEGNGRNIFVMQAEIPKPQSPGNTDTAQIAQQPTGPPPPPPINLKFYGFANRPGEAKAIFLSQGEDVFIAREGEIVDRRYKVLHINPMSVEIEDVLNNNRQSIPLTQG